MCAFIMVVDRLHLPSTAALVREHLGGGWAMAVDIFAADASAAFGVLVASTPKQVEARAPHVMLCEDLKALRHAVQDAADSIDGQCQLLLRLQPHARSVVKGVIADRAATEGSA
jgi:hypothetical protein